jgi:tetratricopeptide (TPR) repeat protein
MSVERRESWPPGLLDHRQVIPRWHSPAVSAWSGEQRGFLMTSAPRQIPSRWAVVGNEDVADRDAYRSVEREELAFLLGKLSPKAVTSPSIERLRTNWQRATERSLFSPKMLPGGVSRTDDQQSVRHLRRALTEHPNQALLWTELSRCYLILGEEAKATRAMECGLKVGGRNTYVTRAAVRLFTHVQDEYRALQVIRRHPNVRRDPRLLSAEIALSALTGVGSLHAKLAAMMVDDARYRPHQLADLTAALATVELEHGKHKLARRLFEKTFPEPTENSLAQVQWASAQDTKIVIPGDAWKTPHSFEAHALASRATRNWDEVVSSAEQWLNAERFSLQPAMLGSFASFSTGQNKKAEDLATAGLQANPGTIGLYNNRAVARALLGRPTEAIEDIREGLRHGGSGDPYLIATLGMVAYRSGDFALGAKCYGIAIADFVTAKDKSTLAYGILMWLRERAAAGDALIGEEYARLKPHLVAVTKFSKEPEVETMIELLESDLRTAVLSNIARPGVSSDELQQTFAQFKPDRRVISLRDSIFEDL